MPHSLGSDLPLNLFVCVYPVYVYQDVGCVLCVQGAQLLGVKMICANLEGANLEGANFEDPAGSSANLEGEIIINRYLASLFNSMHKYVI